jgi:hypothetical protein
VSNRSSTSLDGAAGSVAGGVAGSLNKSSTSWLGSAGPPGMTSSAGALGAGVGLVGGAGAGLVGGAGTGGGTSLGAGIGST